MSGSIMREVRLRSLQWDLGEYELRPDLCPVLKLPGVGLAKQGAFVSAVPTMIDVLTKGWLDDPMTPGLSIEASTVGKKRWGHRCRVVGSQGGPSISRGLVFGPGN